MMRPPLSSAAAGLLRGILARAAVGRERVLLIDFRSVDWQSLTFVGERHEMRLKILGPDARVVADRLLQNLAEAEWTVPGQIVADMASGAPPVEGDDGSITIALEALTIVE
ncbi:hypothetical protein H9L12_03155 [Sphingomonas rhizophila]|uniref:Uncharacterized protein n=1 Tax=Sphingomonas rhizophila TaxID=2071607 RepID=A0A7G9SCL5_9SPHN|nr:hypothetical protein [Sphingomonas rhizophila]QNN65590.1 hypothetical protein H9L12_03155 [Sphingomonas rhizophila]